MYLVENTLTLTEAGHPILDFFWYKKLLIQNLFSISPQSTLYRESTTFV